MPIEESWKRKILVSKELFKHGEQHSSHNTQLNKLAAIAAIHNSIEIMLKAIADYLQVQVKGGNDPKFDDLINAIDTKLTQDGKTGLPYKIEMRNLNRIRNLALHQAILPSDDSIVENKVSARHFLIESTQKYFGYDFEKLSKIEFVKSQDVQTLLEIASINVNCETYFCSQVPAKLAFMIALTSVADIFPGDFRTKYYSRGFTSELAKQTMERIDFTSTRTAIDQLYDLLLNEIKETKATVAILTLGYSLEQIRRFEEISSHISFEIGGVTFPSGTGKTNNEEDKEKSRWYLNLITDIVIDLETTGIELKLPEKYIEWNKRIMESKGHLYH